MGFGCNVPAIVGARALESRRDRLLTVLISPFIACSARTVVILALVGAVFGLKWVIAVYILNILVAGAVGRLISSFVPGTPFGLLMDIPPYRMPPLKSVAAKVWFRTREFLVSAWPALIGASLLMALLEWAGIGDRVNAFLGPFTTGVLGLPAAVGVTLVFGVFRKELTLLMLFQALGTTDVASVMSPGQVLTFVVFVMFYVPCVATIITQVREIGWKWTGISVLLNVSAATVLAFAVRLIAG
jgi:ferrous iron transport protein B